jgi:hypothetical protein
MKDKTLVKSKIVLEDNGTALVTYLWKKTFWFFGYWYPFGTVCSTGKIDQNQIDKITDNNISAVLFENFISPR